MSENTLLNSFCSDVAKQVARSCCSLYFSFNVIGPESWAPGFDLIKSAFVVSLRVYKRDDLPKNLGRTTTKECNKVTFG